MSRELVGRRGCSSGLNGLACVLPALRVEWACRVCLPLKSVLLHLHCCSVQSVLDEMAGLLADSGRSMRELATDTKEQQRDWWRARRVLM